MATLAANTTSANGIAASPAPVTIPHGANRLASNPSSTPRRIAEAHSTNARSGPAYSRIIASWIIVSSRWVDGLSTGSRPASAMVTTASATAASRLAGEITARGSCTVAPTMAARFVEPTRTDSANTDSRIVGSTSDITVISRLAPMPPNAVPVSSPASASVTVPSASTAATAIRSATGSSGEEVVANGTTAATTRTVAVSSSGAARKTHPVPPGVIGSLRSSLRRSRQGCATPAPARPSNRART